MAAEEAISGALRPVVQAAGLEIWDVERSGTSVRVLVEGSEGVDLDAIATLSGAISSVLDERDDLVPAGRYTLEVSSPGLERRLRYPHHFARYVGEDLVVKTTSGAAAPRRLRGKLVAASETELTLLADAGDGGLQEVTLPLAWVERATTVFEWGAPARHPTKQAAGKTPRRTGPRPAAALAPSREAR
ncbi:MAG TPA: ribosome maturation factor RimP [Acidimicrobiales bacterium]|nr:ribosome maturation factor RimP [Acidimicrobiales bacterium]